MARGALLAAACCAVGVSAKLEWPWNTKPEQVHLAFAGPGAMNVAWYTQEKADSIVQYGTTAQLGSTAEGSSEQYLLLHGHHHSATLTGLAEGQKYYYSVGDKKTRSEVFSFRTAPVSNRNVTFSVSIFGDMGWLGSEERPMEIVRDGLHRNWSAQPSRRSIEAMKDKGELDFIWHVGDIAYADDAFSHKGCVLRSCYERVYNGFMNWMQNVSSVMAYMVTPGNHESECHDPLCIIDPWVKKALGNFSAYNARYHMPSAGTGGRASMWYSFDYGPVHFVGTNTETDFHGAGEEEKGDGGFSKCGHFGEDGEYMRWLEQDLKKASASGRWIITGGHRPYHSSELRPAFDLMVKYNVSMYFAGHGHSYARGMANNSMVTVMVGGAGCDEKDNVQLDAVSQAEWLHSAATGGFSTAVTSTGVLTASPTQLQWRLIEGATQKVIDSVTVTR
eukprot:TRINITY_DN5543_c0_g2_i1.p1 TRINITY_DN5543_c0_g2~~TRINITY_DN5543_c0_g2_i1.p1  ORF type:complete len:447 (+),score=165.48 TRINITY_DN5543_c0_g2_i1:86-1426(+)